MKYEIKKIDWLTAGVFVGIFGVLISLMPMFFGLMAFMSRASSRGLGLEVLAFLFFPLGSFAGGFVVGAVFTLIYNLAAKYWQGLRLEITYSGTKQNQSTIVKQNKGH